MSAADRALALEYVSSPTERSFGIFFVPSVAGVTALGRCVAYRTVQIYRIGFDRNPFLLRGSVEKCERRKIKI